MIRSQKNNFQSQHELFLLLKVQGTIHPPFKKSELYLKDVVILLTDNQT